MGTRLLGAKIRADLRPLLDGDEKVVLDFTGVDTVTNSFADAAWYASKTTKRSPA